MKEKKLRVLLTGGGSGGHIYPLLAVVTELKKLGVNYGVNLELTYLGPVDNFSSFLAGEGGVEIKSIWAPKWRRYFSLANLVDTPIFFLSFFQALFKVFWLMPDVIFSKGGPGALTVVLAGWFYRIPIIIHESDAVPGLTNAISARFAKKVALSFEKSLNYFSSEKAFLVGNPIRRELLGERYSSEIAKDELHFNLKENLTLILGGSQGSKRINDFVLSNLEKIILETQILHQTGPANFLEVKNLSRAALMGLPLQTEIEHRYQPVAYLEKDLKAALMAADLVVARAGSGTIFEIAAFGKPAILIPLKESANDHQRINAFEFAKLGGALVIEEENLFPGIFLNQLKEILGDQGKLQRMALASAQFFRPEAATKVAAEIFQLAGFEVFGRAA